MRSSRSVNTILSVALGLLCLGACTHGAPDGAGSNPPDQIHLAFAGVDANGFPNGMAVMWATASPTATSTVRYGLSPNNLTSTAVGTFKSYLPPAAYHTVILTGLLPKRRYYYSVGDAAGGFSAVWSFVSAANTAGSGFRAAVFGDLGYGKNGNAIETRHQLEITKDEYEFVLHVGDISYADDAFLHDPFSFQYTTIYNEYMNNMMNISATRAYMVMPGNHESECHSPACLLHSEYRDGLKNFTAYNARFRMPAPESGATGASMWYSFNYDLAHIIAFDTETDYPNAPEFSTGDSHLLPAGGFAPVGEQLKWFEADLAKANASRHIRPWIFVSGHRPVYSPGKADSNGNPTGPAADLQAAIEDLLIKYKVDIYFSGHIHDYERTWPVAKNKVVAKSYINPTAPTYMVVGGAGCDEMKGKTLETTDPETLEWSALVDKAHYGMGILNVFNSTDLEFVWYASHDNTVLDKFHMHREH